MHRHSVSLRDEDMRISIMLATLWRALMDVSAWIAFSACRRWWTQRTGGSQDCCASIPPAKEIACPGALPCTSCVATPAPGDSTHVSTCPSPTSSASLADSTTGLPALQVQTISQSCSIEGQSVEQRGSIDVKEAAADLGEAGEASAHPHPLPEEGDADGTGEGEVEFTRARQLLGQSWITDTRHESVIFEDEQLELQYHRRRSVVLPCFVRAFEKALGDNQRMWDEGQCLIKDNDDLLEALRRMENELVQAEGDAEYWKTLAEAGGSEDAVRNPPSPSPPPSANTSAVEECADELQGAATSSSAPEEDAASILRDPDLRLSPHNGGGVCGSAATSLTPTDCPPLSGCPARNSLDDRAPSRGSGGGMAKVITAKGHSPGSDASARSPDILILVSPRSVASTPEPSPFHGAPRYRRLPEVASSTREGLVQDPIRQELLRSPRCVVDCGGGNSNSPVVLECGRSCSRSPTVPDGCGSVCKSPSLVDSGRSTSKSPNALLEEQWEQQRLIVLKQQQQSPQTQQRSPHGQHASPQMQHQSPPAHQRSPEECHASNFRQISPQIHQRFNWSPELVKEARRLQSGSPRTLLAYLPPAHGSRPDVAG